MPLSPIGQVGEPLCEVGILSMEEIWKDIPNYEGIYQISNVGRVKRLERKSRNGHCNVTYKELIFKNQLNKDGYVELSFRKNLLQKHVLVHRLVAISFIPNPENKKTVNHKNGIKTDNRVENLEWATQKENTQHAYVVLKIKRRWKRVKSNNSIGK